MPQQTVAITGASGLIGTALACWLRGRGDRVVSLVRHPPDGPDQRRWEPRSGGVDPGALDDVDAVVHLAGAGVGDRRWSPAYKESLLRSRVEGTRAIAEAVAAQADSGHVVRLVSGSAVGYYGSRADEVLTETSPPGDGFLAELVRAWEAETDRAGAAGAPVAQARSGLVMARHGGAFAKLVRLTRLGLGGPVGSGRQWWPWITLTDEVRGLGWLIDDPSVTGPVNLVGPEPRPQRQVAEALGSALRRPAKVPAPAIALRVALGEFADDVLASQRVLPARLLELGFAFAHPTLEAAAQTLAPSGLDVGDPPAG